MAELERAIRKLGPAEKRDGLFQPPEAARIPDSAGKAANGLPKSGNGGDLTEDNYADRTYHGSKDLVSTDGLLTIIYKPIKAVKMKDAGGSPVTLTFAAPTE